jgi:hypothetical protein
VYYLAVPGRFNNGTLAGDRRVALAAGPPDRWPDTVQVQRRRAARTPKERNWSPPKPLAVWRQFGSYKALLVRESSPNVIAIPLLLQHSTRVAGLVTVRRISRAFGSHANGFPW